ncbi:MAG: ferritin family protein [Thermodesulfobacteriota bacterium]
MTEWTMEEALRMALRFERETLEEFQKSAGEASNPAVKSMFLFLADEEVRHMKLIKEMMVRFHVEP